MPSEPHQQFPLFPHLPKELRLQIFSQALTTDSRILKPKPRLQPLNFSSLRWNPYLVGGYSPPFQHISLNTPQRVPEPYYNVVLEPFEYAPHPLLAACKESRDTCLEAGYREWAIDAEQEKVVMWNPRADIVMLARDRQVENPLELFTELYPAEAGEVKRLAVWSSMWKPRAHADRVPTRILWPLVKMAALREMVVVVDEGYEREIVEGRRGWERDEPWMVPGDVEACLKKIRQVMVRAGQTVPDAWEPPSVRVVLKEDGLFTGEALTMRLRDSPDERSLDGLSRWSIERLFGPIHGCRHPRRAH